MAEELIRMSEKELERLEILERLNCKKITQKEAARQLCLCSRQVRRLQQAYKEEGVQGLISKKRGKTSNNCLPSELKNTAIAIVKEYYYDFGPTLAQEYLTSKHGVHLSVETLRQLMITHGLWRAKSKKQARVYQQRERRACFGELVQIDGSHHDWFEGRNAKCCLLVLIDDATSALLGLHFCEAETTQGYFELMHNYFERYGLPMGLYSDKHGVFKVNHEGCDNNLTQYGRAMDELGIELIYASTPQAKGRVERANKTLQDRLVKALRINNISTIEDANSFVAEYIEQHNNKFAVMPESNNNAHCALIDNPEKLNKILSVQSIRKLSKEIECSYNGVTYQIQSNNKYSLQHKKILICEHFQKGLSIHFKEAKLDYKIITNKTKAADSYDEKTINTKVDKLVKPVKKPYKPAATHPWKQYDLIKDKKSATAA